MPKIADGKLSAKQQRFVDSYLKNPNATKAALEAGYSPHSAARTGSENLRKKEINLRIRAERQKRGAESEITEQWVIDRLRENLEGAMAEGQRGPANRAAELIGKHRGMWPNRPDPASEASNGPQRLIVEIRMFPEAEAEPKVIEPVFRAIDGKPN